MKRQFYLFGLCLLATCKLWAQQAYTVTDTQPLQLDGLTMGYNIKSEEVREVSGKGNFSRFAVRFYISNPSNQAKIMLYKQGFNLFDNVSDQVVQFNCLNATGARFTSKQATLSAPACNVMALVDDKDPANGKTVKNKRFVQIGYWVRAGETISADEILIVPLNEKPNVKAVYLANSVQQPAIASVGNRPVGITDVNLNQPVQSNNGQGFSRLKSMFNSTYINVETGAVKSTPITGDWQSAQWQLIPVPGTNYVNVRNRYRLSYINVKMDNVELSPNFQTATGMWTLEPTNDPNIFRLKNVETRRYLCIVSDQLTSSMSPGVGFNSSWTLEPVN